ncbi:MAG: glycosyltransferase family 4 protein, partial [Bacteroidia bacterium]|nr:glycosyltransferase family 4 protein [Bacteroidia bacterium]
IGVFVNELAKHVKHLYFFQESQLNIDSEEEDYAITNPNITIVDLGPKSTFYKRLLFPETKLKIIDNYINNIDLLLLRTPSPLSPHIHKRFADKIPVINLLVGNYMRGLSGLAQPTHRKVAIIALTMYYQLLQHRMLRGANVIVNSHQLLNDNKNRAKDIFLVKTTTINEDTFFVREDTCTNNPIHLLFTGRINFQKGLRELIETVGKLYNKHNIILDIVGWEEKGQFSYQQHLMDLAHKLNISDRVIFHGKKKIGPELNEFYRHADIYVLPSYHEGFPRTIWEAMAHSLPVITTSVGGIPYYLDNECAIIIEPKNTNALTEAIDKLVTNSELRKNIIKNGFDLVKTCTLEYQTKELIGYLKKQINE